jgi:epoxyqueuosine reductase
VQDPATGHHQPQTEGAGLSGRALAERLTREALALGFAAMAVAPADRLDAGGARLDAWLAAGHDADLDYMRGGDRADPRALLPGARSVIVAALATPTPTLLRRSAQGEPLRGGVAAFARGTDYHLVMKEKLRALADALANAAGQSHHARIAVDTAPLLERELAARAGLGFVGKSTLLIIPGIGTNVMLGELITDLAIDEGAAMPAGCGGCVACIDACPTGAIVAAFVVDARRCISYWTIEHHGLIPLEIRPLIGARIFGCDDCQAVCPFDASASASPRPHAPELAGRIDQLGIVLTDLLSAGNASHRRLVRRTALRRVSRDVLARNAAVALGNSGDRSVVPALAQALASHPSALVRAHAAWALGRLGGSRAEPALVAALADPDPDVRREAALARGELERAHPVAR